MRVVAVALTEDERMLVARAVGELVEREGLTDTSADLLELLAHALPAEAFGALVEIAA